MDRNPEYSIIIPTYNRAHLIAKTIQSCVDQNFEGLYEIIVVDDGSTDNTKAVVESFGNLNIHYCRKENGERGAARNYGVHKASGRFVTFLDSDDILYPNHLINAAFFQNSHNPEIFHLGYEIKDTRGKILKQYNHVPNNNLNRFILKGNYMSCMGVFLKRDIALQNPFSEIRKLSGTEDWLLWLKLAARHKIHFTTEISAALIDHEERSIKNYSEAELQDRTNILLHNLVSDHQFIQTFGRDAIRRIQGHMETYAGLHLILSGHKKDGLLHFLRGVKCSPAEFFTRRTLATFKNLF